MGKGEDISWQIGDLYIGLGRLEKRVENLEHASKQEQCDHKWEGQVFGSVHCVRCGKKLPMYEEVKVGDLHNVIMISGLPLEEYSKWELAQIIKRLSEQLENK